MKTIVPHAARTGIIACTVRASTLLLPALLPVATVPFIPRPALAWKIVYDPTNYSQNLLSAARALEQIGHQVTSLQNEAQMLLNQAKNLTKLPTSLLSEIEGNFSEMKNLLGEADKLAYNVQNIEEQFNATYRDFASGDRTAAQLVSAAQQRWQQSVSAFEHSLKAGAVAVGNIEDTQRQTSEMVDASQSAVGVLQATQAGNQLLAVQAKQMSDLTALLAAQGRADVLEQARLAASREEARERFGRFMNGTGYSSSSVQMFHD